MDGTPLEGVVDTPQKGLLSRQPGTALLPGSFRWGIYVRLSDDRSGSGVQVQRQEDDARARIAQRGGHVPAGAVYDENDTSAFKKKTVKIKDDDGATFEVRRVIRPEFQRALRDLRRGLLDGLMVYDLDRLARDNRDLEDCREVIEQHQCVIESASPGQLDLHSSDGMTLARVLVAMANKSSADTARRTARAHYAAAQTGKPVGGRRPFGWQDDKSTLNSLESEMIRDAARRILDGQRLHRVAQLWNASGMPTPRGKATWTRATLIQILTNARLCGYRTYHGELMYKDGKPVQGLWEPILEVEDWERLCLVLTRKSERSQRRNSPGGTGRKYLWSGFLRCGKPGEDGAICGSRMHGYPRANGKIGFTYACRAKADGGCGSVSISGLHADAYLTELVLTALDAIAVDDAAPDQSPLPQDNQLSQLRQGRATLGALVRSGQMSQGEYLQLRDETDAEIQDLERARSVLFRERDRPVGGRGDWRSRWDEFDLDQRRLAIADARLDHVIVRPAASRYVNRFDPARLHPVWRGAAS